MQPAAHLVFVLAFVATVALLVASLLSPMLAQLAQAFA